MVDEARFLQLDDDYQVKLTEGVFDGGRGSADWSNPEDGVHLVLLRLAEGQGAFVVYGFDAATLRHFSTSLTKSTMDERRLVRGFTESGQPMRKGAKLPTHWLTAC
jgi:hypothetical protein